MSVARRQLLPRSERVIAFVASKIRMFATSCHWIRLLFWLSVGRLVLDQVLCLSRSHVTSETMILCHSFVYSHHERGLRDNDC